MIKIDRKTCHKCQRCCHGTPGDHIPAKLPADEPIRFDRFHRCERLNSRNNCNLMKKPMECAIYPIVIADGEIFVDMACPGWKEAIKQWDEQFGGHIDDYRDGNDDHKFVNLWVARVGVE